MKSIADVRSLLVLFYLGATFGGVSGCGRGWYQYGNHCFFISNILKTKLLARLWCHRQDSDLASISDEETRNYIAQQTAKASVDRFWVGLQEKPDGQLMWMNGKSVDDTQPWVQVDSKPDGDYGSSYISCFGYNGTTVSRMDCYDRIGYICSHANITDNLTCKDHSALRSFVGEVTGNCLFWSRQATTWEKADETCNQSGGRFLGLDGVMKDGLGVFNENEVLTNNGLKYWTGLTWNGTHAVWSSGKPLGNDFLIPIINGSGSCITVQFNFTDVLKTHLFQTDCSELAYAICFLVSPELTTTPTVTDRLLNDDYRSLTCPSPNMDTFSRGSWKPLSNYCYWETSFETQHKTWYDAERFCQSYGGHLASFHSLDEEKVGLSFQHGKLLHAYWIGLTLDVENETYRWSDGSPLDYNNWAPGHPNHQDKRLRCVAMDAKETHWVSSLCGIHSWFVCKVRKSYAWPEITPPQPDPLELCDGTSRFSNTELYYFDGSCYFLQMDSVSWHRALTYCENEGATLVSVHTDEELEFLLKMLYVATDDFVHGGSHVWIGLNSLNTEWSMQWTDRSPVDYTYWNSNEPDNYMSQERCCNMDIKNGMWSDENCNAVMGFVCKRRNDTSVTTISSSTPDSRVGNCKKGWIAHDDRCYYIGGRRQKDRVNWTQALETCNDQNAYLTSARNQRDQAFLSYLLQSLKMDAWIGLHDTIQSGRYYWVDNSELRYTNWSPGEPSLFGLVENCVKMVYDGMESGEWKDTECSQKLGYICQTKKDPDLLEPFYDRGINCLNHEGWLKLNSMCYKMFGGNFLTWSEAESACQREGGHLVSVFDKHVKAVVSYLATEVNSSFWIGLRYNESTRKLEWLNKWPMKVSFWEKNEPSYLSGNSCFASTLEGYWKKVPCEEVLPFMCHITTGKPPKQRLYRGGCPVSAKKWISSAGSFCYLPQNRSRGDFFAALLACYRHGSHLASIHSMEEVESLKNILGLNTPVYIGLFKNHKEGFGWLDNSPVDFVNWDENEPDGSKYYPDDLCVEMMASTLKWKVTSCSDKKGFICVHEKDIAYYEDSQNGKLIGDREGEVSASAVVIATIFSVISIVLIIAAVLYYTRNVRNRSHHQLRQQSVSFENAMYNVSMEFQGKVES